MRSLFALLSLTLLLVPASARAEEPPSLRVISWNVWGVPFVSAEREARVRQIGPSIAALHPDVVLLQELWSEADAQLVIRALADAGLTHQTHGASDRFAAFGSSGLLIAANRPLRSVDHLEYELGRWPHTPYHLDWLSRKSALSAVIDTPGGSLVLVNTHWQAAYRTGNYAPVRAAQALELCEWLREREAPHLLLAGDFNVGGDERATDLLTQRLRLVELTGEPGLDRIFAAGVRLDRVQRDLDQPLKLTGGVLTRLSDHPAWVVDVSLEESRGEIIAGGVERELFEQLSRESRTLSRQIWSARVVSLLGALMLLRVLIGDRVRGLGFGWFARRRRAVRALLLLAAGLGTAYGAYFAWGYGAAQTRGLERAMQRVAE